MSQERTLSYSRPADVLELMLLGFLTVEEGRAKYSKAGGDIRIFEAFVTEHQQELAGDEDALP